MGEDIGGRSGDVGGGQTDWWSEVIVRTAVERGKRAVVVVVLEGGGAWSWGTGWGEEITC